MVTTITMFPAKKLLFEREYRGGNYAVSSWALSFMAIEIPREMAYMALYTFVLVSVTGKGFFLGYWLTDFAGASLGILCGAIGNDIVEAVFVMIFPFVLMICCSGYDLINSLSHSAELIASRLNPLYMMIRLFQIYEWREGNFVPTRNYTFMAGLEEDEFCDNYTSWRVYDANRNTFDNSSDDMNCSELEAYSSFSELYEANQHLLVEPAQDTILCEKNLTTTMMYGDLSATKYGDISTFLISTVVVSVLCRLLAVLVLYISSKDGFSWLRNRINEWQCCYCDGKKPTDTEIAQSFSIDDDDRL